MNTDKTREDILIYEMELLGLDHEAELTRTCRQSIINAMQVYADQEKKKYSLSYQYWRKENIEWVEDLKGEYFIKNSEEYLNLKPLFTIFI